MQILTDEKSLDQPIVLGNRPHLAYLDGLRGLAALYIAIFHIYTEVNYRWLAIGWPHRVWLASQWMIYGHSAVAVFIVLSGYCLMLPVVRAENGQLSGGVLGFLKRRAIRIIPPYYAALVLSIIMLLCTPRLQKITDTYWDFALPGLTWPIIISHLFLVHDLAGFGTAIDPPMWSIAVEWHIYFVFALFLLPVWRRFGVAGILIAGLFLGVILPHLLFEKSQIVQGFCSIYISLFAFGMAGACINFSASRHLVEIRNRVPWGVLLSILLLFNIMSHIQHLNFFRHLTWLGIGWVDDIRAGLTTILLIVFCTRASLQPSASPRHFVVRLLSQPVLVKLGAFSYSLYLVHQPLEALFYLNIHNLVLSPTVRLGVMLMICLPLVIFCAYLFHLVFERPFLVNRVRKQADLKPLVLAETLGKV